MRLWWVPVIAAAGCGRVAFDAVIDSDGGGVGPFSGAAIVPSLSSPANDDDPALSSDGLELYFASTRPGGAGATDIWVSTRSSRSLPWEAPTPVTVVNSGRIDKGPSIAAGGLELWFSSDRVNGDQLYVATRSMPGAPWTEPVVVPALTTAFGSSSPYRAGSDLVLRRRLPDNTFDLAQSEYNGSDWSTPQTIADLTTPFTESGPELAAGGGRLYFDSDRDGDFEIYVSEHDPMTNQFGPPTLVAGVSSAQDESDGSVSGDERIIVFRRDGPDGDGEIWMATRE